MISSEKARNTQYHGANAIYVVLMAVDGLSHTGLRWIESSLTWVTYFFPIFPCLSFLIYVPLPTPQKKMCNFMCCVHPIFRTRTSSGFTRHLSRLIFRINLVSTDTFPTYSLSFVSYLAVLLLASWPVYHLHNLPNSSLCGYRLIKHLCSVVLQNIYCCWLSC